MPLSIRSHHAPAPIPSGCPTLAPRSHALSSRAPLREEWDSGLGQVVGLTSPPGRAGWPPFFAWALPTPHGAWHLCPDQAGPRGPGWPCLIIISSSRDGRAGRRAAQLHEGVCGQGWLWFLTRPLRAVPGGSRLCLRKYGSSGWCRGAHTFCHGHASPRSAWDGSTDMGPDTFPEWLPGPWHRPAGPAGGWKALGDQCQGADGPLGGSVGGPGADRAGVGGGEQGLFHLLLPALGGRRRAWVRVPC